MNLDNEIENDYNELKGRFDACQRELEMERDKSLQLMENLMKAEKLVDISHNEILRLEAQLGKCWNFVNLKGWFFIAICTAKIKKFE